MLGSKPIIEIQHTGACGRADPPCEIPQKRRRSDRIGAAVEVENAAVAARLANHDVNGVNPAAVDRGGSGACRRARYKTFDALEPATNRRYGQPPTAWTLFHDAQG